MEREVDELFDCFELPAVPGGFRGALTDGISTYLGIRFSLNKARYEAMKEYPEAFCRLVRAVADEARKLKSEGIPPFNNSKDQRGTEKVHGKVEVEIMIRSTGYYRTYINTMSEKQTERLLKRWKKFSKEDKNFQASPQGQELARQKLREAADRAEQERNMGKKRGAGS